MRIGLESQSTDQSAPILQLAGAGAERGFTSLWVNEHTHVPVAHPRSQYPPGGPIPERYARLWDPFVALAFVAATSGLEVGTAICQVGEHDPIVLAKTVATLDVLSGGRFTFGVGFGWLREEFEHHGLPSTSRAAIVAEKVEAIRRLWTEDQAGFDGDYVRFSPSWSWPKPCQKPHPPILLGAPDTERNLARVVAWADGWIPMGSWATDPGFPERLGELRHRWEEAGRDPGSLRVVGACMTESVDAFVEAHDRAVAVGFEQVLLHVRDLSLDAALNLMDGVAARLLR